MKVFIIVTQELNEYSIYKVSDDKVDRFKDEFKNQILIEGKSIQDVIIQFNQLAKQPGIEFNSELKKYSVREMHKQEVNKVKHRL